MAPIVMGQQMPCRDPQKAAMDNRKAPAATTNAGVAEGEQRSGNCQLCERPMHSCNCGARIAAPTPGTSEALASAQKVIEAWDKANQAGESTPGQEDAILEYQDLLIYFDYDKNEGNIALALAREVQRLSAELDNEKTHNAILRQNEQHMLGDVEWEIKRTKAANDAAWISILRNEVACDEELIAHLQAKVSEQLSMKGQTK